MKIMDLVLGSWRLDRYRRDQWRWKDEIDFLTTFSLILVQLQILNRYEPYISDNFEELLNVT
jgi:hypothetical protein